MQSYVDQTMYDREGESIGRITDVILDPRTLDPELVTVKPGRFRQEHIVPLSAVQNVEGQLRADFPTEVVKAAPRPKNHTAPTGPEREGIYEYYGVPAPEPDTGPAGS